MAVLKLIKHVPIRGTIRCLTGLRIGGSKDDIEIGGTDNPIIRDPRTRMPYIPGSSLKGKLRSTLEYHFDKVGNRGEPCSCTSPTCFVCILFGPHKAPSHNLGPTRVLVRDGKMKMNAGDDPDQWVEVKSETAIDRATGTAYRGSLRQNERVVPGAEFDLEISVRIFKEDKESEILEVIHTGLTLIENEYLGASGSRGYGKVKFIYDTPTEWNTPA